MENTIQIKDIRIKVNVEDDLQTGVVEVVLHAEGKRKTYLCAQLLTENGKEADRIFPVAVENEIDFCMQVYEVQLWNAESVCLYDLLLELRDEKMRLLGCTVKKIAFRKWEINGNVRTLNGKFLKWRPRLAPTGFLDFREEEQRRFLSEIKRQYVNAILLETDKTKSDATDFLSELCLQYGIYLLWNDEAVQMPAQEYVENGENPDFEFQVTQQGVLLENRSVFINASEYDLHYSLARDGKIIREGILCADVPAGVGRYIDVPFGVPQEASEYVYRVALCLKKDTAWAEKGAEIASKETVISNMFFEGEKDENQERGTDDGESEEEA